MRRRTVVPGAPPRSFSTSKTDSPSVSRDLALIKVQTPSGQVRSEVLQIVETFRARVVDVALNSLMVEVTGAEDKINGLAEVLRPFGIIEMVRTGRVAMSRGRQQSSRREETYNGEDRFRWDV